MPRAAVAMAAGRGGDGGGAAALYSWLDSVPLSRPRRNLARDFSDGVLAAEVVKFFLPALVQLHSYVPASATAQKLANWGHLNRYRQVLSRLNCRLPQALIRELAQARPGAAEQVLELLRSRIQERLRQSQDPGVPAALGELSYMETGNSKAGGGCTQESPKAAGAQKPQAEQEKALLLAQETIQILQLKVRRLEELLRLKNVRIDDLSRLLREAQRR